MVGEIEAFTEFLNGVKFWVDLAPLDKTDLTEIQTGLLSQFFLGSVPSSDGLGGHCRRIVLKLCFFS